MPCKCRLTFKYSNKIIVRSLLWLVSQVHLHASIVFVKCGPIRVCLNTPFPEKHRAMIITHTLTLLAFVKCGPIRVCVCRYMGRGRDQDPLLNDDLSRFHISFLQNPIKV